jgi:hypothetical protein
MLLLLLLLLLSSSIRNACRFLFENQRKRDSMRCAEDDDSILNEISLLKETIWFPI